MRLHATTALLASILLAGTTNAQDVPEPVPTPRAENPFDSLDEAPPKPPVSNTAKLLGAMTKSIADIKKQRSDLVKQVGDLSTKVDGFESRLSAVEAFGGRLDSIEARLNAMDGKKTPDDNLLVATKWTGTEFANGITVEYGGNNYVVGHIINESNGRYWMMCPDGRIRRYSICHRGGVEYHSVIQTWPALRAN